MKGKELHLFLLLRPRWDRFKSSVYYLRTPIELRKMKQIESYRLETTQVFQTISKNIIQAFCEISLEC